MGWLIFIGAWVVVLVFVMALCKVAGDADRRIEEMMYQDEKEKRREKEAAK